MRTEKVKEYMEYLRGETQQYPLEFYVALLLYDVLDIPTEDVNEDLVDRAYDIQDEYETIYNYDLREDIKDLIGE